jgi:hypothetical protein
VNTTAIDVSGLQSPSRSRLTARLAHFGLLMKPRVMLLAVFTALVGLVIAPGHLDLLLGLLERSRHASKQSNKRLYGRLACPKKGSDSHSSSEGVP